MNIEEKLRVVSNKLKLHGIPLFYFRDPITRQPSVSLTILLISVHILLFALLNRFGKWFQGVDLDGALQFFYASSALYFGRGLSDKSGNELKAPKKED